MIDLLNLTGVRKCYCYKMICETVESSKSKASTENVELAVTRLEKPPFMELKDAVCHFLLRVLVFCVCEHWVCSSPSGLLEVPSLHMKTISHYLCASGHFLPTYIFVEILLLTIANKESDRGVLQHFKQRSMVKTYNTTSHFKNNLS